MPKNTAPINYPEGVDQERWEYIQDGGSFVFRVPSVHDAIALATKMKNDGIRDLFRGQTNSKWPVISTLWRLYSEQAEAAKTTLGRFAGWAKSEPQMAAYAQDEDSLISIAQHYGLATPFIDFTSKPEVAAFFALDSQQKPKKGQFASIICLKEADFTEFWTQCGDVICGEKNARKPEILRINVENLWRLQAQRGCFLWSPLKEIESWYDFDRIVFPFDKKQLLKLNKCDVYPENQSSLELTLARFFMNEQMRKARAALDEICRVTKFPIHELSGSHDATGWHPTNLKRTPDWDGSELWQLRSSEHAENVLAATPIKLSQPHSAKDFSHELLRAMSEDFISRHRSYGLMLSWDGASPQDIEVLRLASCIRLLWNGMRRLPFTDTEVRTAIEVAVHMFFSKQYEPTILTVISSKDSHDRPVDVEFSGSKDGCGAYSRAYVSRDGLVRALNPHFIDAVTKNRGSFPAKIETVMLIPARPWERFSFQGLRTLMVTEIIPSQIVLYASHDQDEALNRAFYFSPAELTIFGLT